MGLAWGRAMSQVSLYIEPSTHHFLNDRLFEMSPVNSPSSLARCLRHLREHLTARGVSVHTADRLPAEIGPDPKVYVSFGMLRDYRRVAERGDVTLSAIIMKETPVVEPSLFRRVGEARTYFKRIFSVSDDPALDRFVGARLDARPFRWPINHQGIRENLWDRADRDFMVMINMNKLPRVYWNELYTERMRAVEYFARHGEVDLYGIGWDGPSFRMGQTFVPGSVQKLQRLLTHQWHRFRPDPRLVIARKVYKGQLDTKLKTLASYKFSLCFENTLTKGWLTEKIFDCFHVGTIPIYWGATDIEELIPPECFIDMRRFANYDELRTFLRSRTNEDIEQYRRSARDFLQSPAFRPFSREAFIAIFERILEQDAGLALGVDR